MLRTGSNGTLGYTENIHIIKDRFLNQYGMAQKMYTPAQIKQKLGDYRIFTVVRNSIDRIISAYNSKVIIHDWLVHNEYKLLKMYLNDVNSPEADKDVPSFSSFLEMLLSDSRAARNEHFLGYFTMVNPCHIDYQYILKMETLDHDLQMFLPQVYTRTDQYKGHGELHVNPALNSENKTSSIRTMVKLNRYEDIDSSLVTKVLNLHKYELLFFGYTFDNNQNMACCRMLDDSGSKKNCC